MRPGLMVGVDIGTSASKAVVFDPSAGVLGSGSAPHPVDIPRPGLAEQDPRDWYTSACAAVRAALHGAGGAGDVSTIAVSGQGAAVVTLDAAGTPLRPAMIHLDQRARPEVERLRAGEVGRLVAAAWGGEVSAWNTVAKLTWLARHEPAVFSGAAVFTSAGGYLLHRLTGEAYQSHSDAGVSDLFDLARRVWAEPVTTALGIAPRRLPRLAPSTAAVGRLHPDAAADLGLRPACLVVTGGEDASSAALTAGVTAAGHGFLSLGTAGVLGIGVASGAPIRTPLLRFPHVIDGLDLVSGSSATVGGALRWLGELLGRGPSELLELASAVPAGADGVEFLPSLAGELHPIDDPDARGAFTGLSLASHPGSLARAVVEGTAAAISHNLAAAQAAGASPVALTATGGPTRSALWCQAIADATGLPVAVCDRERAGEVGGAPLGDAILAASEGAAEAAELATHHLLIGHTYEPDPAAHERAQARLARLQRVYRASRCG